MRKFRNSAAVQLGLLALAIGFAVAAVPKHASATPPTCKTECTPGWNGCAQIGAVTCYRGT